MASSLGAFLETMYKKRELEYKAKLAQSEADVAGAQAIGSAIGSVGKAVGSIGSGIGDYMQSQGLDPQTQRQDAAARGVLDEYMGVSGVPRAQAVDPSQQGPADIARNRGAALELQMRDKAGMFQNNQMTPYQANRLDLAVQVENRRRQERLDRVSDASTRGATKAYTDTVANTTAYQNNSAANMAKLYDADTPEAFNAARTQQISLNQGASKAGISDDVVSNYQVPSEFIPKPNRPAHEYYKYQQQFSKGTTVPDEMARRRQAAAAQGQTEAGDPTISFGTGPNQIRPPTYQSGLEGFKPPGAVADPVFRGNVGDTGKIGGKPYKWNGNFWVPQ